MQYIFIIIKNNQANRKKKKSARKCLSIKLSRLRIKLQVYEIYWRHQLCLCESWLLFLTYSSTVFHITMETVIISLYALHPKLCHSEWSCFP